MVDDEYTNRAVLGSRGEELNPEQIARDIQTLRDEGAEIDAEEKRFSLTYAPESPASGGYVFRAIAARYEYLAQQVALGSRGAHEELIEALVRRLPALHDSDGYGGDLISRDDLLEAFSETAAALRGVGTPPAESEK